MWYYKYMKKSLTKKNGIYRILSLLLCFMFLLFVGCSEEGGDEEGDGGIGTSLLNSAVVLSRPADYFEKDYVGEHASVNYYNKYSQRIFYNLYKAYSDADYEKDGTSMLVGDKKYLYDAIRYAVKSVRNTYNSSDVLIQQEVVIDLNAGWNWGVPQALDIVLRNNGVNVTVVDDLINNTKTFIYNTAFFTTPPVHSDWSEVFDNNTKTSYNKYYYYDENGNSNIAGVTQYYYSPYYNDGVSDAMNFYQDALEYAIYMISLGYNRVDQPGFFNFETTFDSTTNAMTGMNLIGKDENGADAESWEGKGGTISVSKALDYAKDLYNRTATYVGITQGNKDDIVDFILNVVIGKNAWGNETNKGQFQVAETVFTSTGASTGTTTNVTIDRNYEAVVRDILDVVCKEVPIGYDQEKGEDITLDNPYPAAVVTTYPGNKFMGSYDGEDDAFQFSTAQEYQSIVLDPMAEDLDEIFTDLWLQFEYYDNPDEANLKNLPAIDINIGLRYYSKDGECINIGEGSITVDYLKNSELDTSVNFPDKYWFYFSDLQGEADVHIKDEIKLQSQFINPFAGSLVLGNASVPITGTTNAHKYYTVEDFLVEGSHGTHGVLNSEMFKDKCDYLEVYFDVQKDKANPTINYNYNFKVLVASIKFGNS